MGQHQMNVCASENTSSAKEPNPILLPSLGGELGGPTKYKVPTAILMFCIWIFYVILSALVAYEIVPGF